MNFAKGDLLYDIRSMHDKLAGLDRNLSPFVSEADLPEICWCTHPGQREGKSRIMTDS
jgi:hypothetical protein